LQRLDFALIQFAPFAGFHVLAAQHADVRADQAADGVSQRGGDAANLAFFPFRHGDTEGAFARVTLGDLDGTRRGHAVFKFDAVLPAIQRFDGGQPDDGDAVGFGMVEARMRQAFCQFAVVGQDDQAFAVGVEASNREQALVFERDKIVDRIAVIVGVRLCGREGLHGLVERDVAFGRLVEMDARAVHLDHISGFVCLVAQLDDRAVDAHAPARDHVFCGTTRCDVRLCQQFLNSFFHEVLPSESKVVDYRPRAPRCISVISSV
jgi:hypothetical protein